MSDSWRHSSEHFSTLLALWRSISWCLLIEGSFKIMLCFWWDCLSILFLVFLVFASHSWGHSTRCIIFHSTFLPPHIQCIKIMHVYNFILCCRLSWPDVQIYQSHEWSANYVAIIIIVITWNVNNGFWHCATSVLCMSHVWFVSLYDYFSHTDIVFLPCWCGGHVSCLFLVFNESLLVWNQIKPFCNWTFLDHPSTPSPQCGIAS